MKSEYRKGLEDGLKILENILDRMEFDKGFNLENAREILRDEKNMSQND